MRIGFLLPSATGIVGALVLAVLLGGVTAESDLGRALSPSNGAA